MEVQGRTVEASAVGEGVFNNQLQMHSTGPIYADRLRQPSASTDSTTPALERRSASSMACSDPGVYRGTKNENFEEFLRRFKRKYEQVTKIRGSDAVRLGRSAGAFYPMMSTAAHQEIAEFCAVLEKLGRQANPECTVEDRSLEYAQILLENLREWPEHYQLVGALHKVDPRRAYEEVKQLALSIEQSKIMFEVGRRPADLKWKERAAQYRGYGFVERAGAPSFSRSRPEQGRDTPNRGEELGGRGNYQSSRTQRQARNVRPAQHGSSQEGVENRKCYKCSKYGHVARDCPVRTARVNQIEPREEAPSRKDETLSAIVNRARCMGMSVREKGVSADELIGEKVTVPLNILNEDCQALIDTGSMISIVPVELLAKVQDKGFDLDSLGMVPKSKLKPVVDASNNRMDFLAAVYLPVKLNQETTQNVAFHISPKKEMEIILGTNALARLGINISIERERDSSVNKSVKDEANESKVVVAERRYIPPGDTALVEVLLPGSPEAAEVWESGDYGHLRESSLLKTGEHRSPYSTRVVNPYFLKEGEDVGRWGTDKWLERWEEANPLLMGAREDNLRAPERLRVLEELIADNMEPGSMDEDLQRSVRRLGPGIESDGLSAYDHKYTGDSPNKMKAKTGSARGDLVKRSVIEPSKSDWAFPIVLVGKKRRRYPVMCRL
ncbi:zinc knuckle [Ostertagia ostertagi]